MYWTWLLHKVEKFPSKLNKYHHSKHVHHNLGLHCTLLPRGAIDAQLCTELKLVTKTNLITKADFYELAPEDGQSESFIDLNVDLEYDSSYVYLHWSNNELVEINKDVDESKEDAGNGTNDDNGLLGNSDKYDCNQITRYENDQWIVEHMLKGV